WIKDREAAARSEPEASIRGAASSATRRIGRGALGATQAVFHAVVQRLQRLPLPLRERFQLPFFDAADAARGGQPKRLAIIFDLGNVIAEQSVLFGIAHDAPIMQRVQAALERGDPQRALGILVERADLIARKPVGGSVDSPSAAIDAPQPLAIGPDPQRAVA